MSVFDLFAIALFIGAACTFIARVRHEFPPAFPFAVVCVVAAVGNWLGEHGGGGAAVCLLIGGAFMLLHLASLPYPEESESSATR